MFVVSTEFNVEAEGIIDGEKLDLLYRDFMDDIGDFAVKSFRKHTPFDPDSPYHMIEHIHKGDVNKHVWGYSIEVGITPVEEAAAFGADPEYPKFVDQGSTGNLGNFVRASAGSSQLREKGTGLFSGTLENVEPGNLIVAPPGNVMAFEKKGEVVFTRSIKPQVGQFFSDIVDTEVNAYIRARKQELKLETRALT